MRMTVEQVLNACKGKLLYGEKGTEISAVGMDSRTIAPGALFVPLIGERSDGHRYIGAVLEKGAAATLTQEHDHADPECGAWIRVDDTKRALQEIAAAYRNSFALPVVGITGSVGKTSTKEMVALALSAGFSVMKTAGNYNSQIGLPLTLFQLEPSHTAAVVEMGMSDFGEMERLAQIARPDCAVVTNIGLSHIENLKTQQNICAEKLHITDGFTENSVLFLNGDDPVLRGITSIPTGKIVFYGTGEEMDYRAEQITVQDGFTHYTLHTPTARCRVTLPTLGLHNVLNSLAAIAVGEHLGLPLEQLTVKLNTYTPPAMRQEIHRANGRTVLDDSYNASPDSMKSGLEVLRHLPGRRVAVLADMLELGEAAQAAHVAVGEAAAQAGVELLVAVGQWGAQMAQGARAVCPEMAVFACRDNDEAWSFLEKNLRDGDCILVKGSRGMHTDEIVKKLLQ